MSSDPVARIMAMLIANGAELIRQSGMSNQAISTAAEKAGVAIAPKSVSNMLAGRHAFTIKSLAAFAAATGVAPWLLLAPRIPERNVRQDLEWLVETFASLPDEDRESMMRAARNAAIAAGLDPHGSDMSADREVGRLRPSKSGTK